MENIWPYDFIGDTPSVLLDDVFLKIEGYNPTGSIKDRAAWHMMKRAEERGGLRKGMEIVEATSGNTGISLAMLSALRGYAFTAIMPEGMSPERSAMMRSYGANVVLTPAEEGSAGSKKALEDMTEGRRDVWSPRQFENPDNIEAHRLGTGPEIARELPEIDAFVAGIGTGGTLIGVAKAFEDAGMDVLIVGVEPEESAVLSGKEGGKHGIQGIGRGEITAIIENNRGFIDRIVTVKTKDALDAMKYLWRERGISCGVSSGANFLAARRLAMEGYRVATVLPDRGDRYLSLVASWDI